MGVLKTEFEFQLPVGYVDPDGNLHREGVMRLATASDEIIPMKDHRTQENIAFLPVILLSRVVTKLGGLQNVSIAVVEKLFSEDFEYLQDLYNRLNRSGSHQVSVSCPKCGEHFQSEVESLGEV